MDFRAVRPPTRSSTAELFKRAYDTVEKWERRQQNKMSSTKAASRPSLSTKGTTSAAASVAAQTKVSDPPKPAASEPVADDTHGESGGEDDDEHATEEKNPDTDGTKAAEADEGDDAEEALQNDAGQDEHPDSEVESATEDFNPYDFDEETGPKPTDPAYNEAYLKKASWSIVHGTKTLDDVLIENPSILVKYLQRLTAVSRLNEQRKAGAALAAAKDQVNGDTPAEPDARRAKTQSQTQAHKKRKTPGGVKTRSGKGSRPPAAAARVKRRRISSS